MGVGNESLIQNHAVNRLTGMPRGQFHAQSADQRLPHSDHQGLPGEGEIGTRSIEHAVDRLMFLRQVRFPQHFSNVDFNRS